MGKVSNLLLATSILTSLTIGTSTAQALEKVDVQQEETQPDLQASNNNETEQSQSQKLKLKTSSEEEPKQEESNQEVVTSSDTEEVKTSNKKEETEKQNEQSKQKVEKSSKKVNILDTLKKEDASPLKTMYLKVNFSEIEQMLGSESPKDVTIKIKNSKGVVIGTGKALSSKQNEFGDTEVKVSLKSPIKYNDKVSITVESSNKTFKGVSIKTVDTITAEENEYLVKNKKYTSLTIDASVYDEKMGLSENFTKYAKYQLYGSKVSPLNMVIEADNSSSIINVIYKGKGLANETIELNGKKYTTNKYGVIYYKGNPSKVKVGVLGGNLKTLGGKEERYFSPISTEGTYVFNVELVKPVKKETEKKPENKVAPTTKTLVTVGVSNQNYIKLTKDWIDGQIVFEPVSEKAIKATNGIPIEYDINKMKNEIYGLPNGQYKVSFKSESAKFKSNTTTFTQGKNNQIKVTATPKYFLNVNKDGEKFAFMVDVDGFNNKKILSNGEQLTFGVAPNMTLVLTDQADKEPYNVNIGNKAKETTLVLGQGVVYGSDISTPHTGDSAIFFIIALALSLIGLGVVGYLYYRKKNLPSKKDDDNDNNNHHNNRPNSNSGTTKKATTSFLSLLLVASTLVPFVSPYEAQAGSQGGSSGGSLGGKTPPTTGTIGMRKDVSVLGISLQDSFEMVKGKQKFLLTKDTTIGDLKKFQTSTKNIMARSFLMPMNPTSKSVLRNNTTTIAIDTGNSLIRVTGAKDALKLGYIKNDDEQSNAVKGSKNERVLPLPEDAVKSTNLFTAYVGFTAMALEGNPKTRQLWKKSNLNSSSSAYDYGKVAEQVFKDMEKLKKKYSKKSQAYKNLVAIMDEDGKLKSTAILLDYQKKLKATNQIAESEWVDTVLEDKEYTDDEIEYGLVAMYYQAYIGFQKYQGSTLRGATMLMSTTSASNWYLRGMKNSRRIAEPSLQYLVEHNARYEEKVIDWGGSTAGLRANEAISKKYPTYTFSKTARETVRSAIKPKSTEVSKNSYTGWGYQNLGVLEGDLVNPKLYVKIRYKDISTGKLTKYEFVPKYGGKNGESLRDILAKSNLSDTTSVFKGDRMYHVLGEDVKVKLKSNKTIDGERVDLNFKDMKKLKTPQEEVTVTKTVREYNGQAQWRLQLKSVFNSYPISNLSSLPYILGGDRDKSTIAVGQKRLFPHVPSKGKKIPYSDATIYITLDASVKKKDLKPKIELTTPQWATSMYYPSLYPEIDKMEGIPITTMTLNPTRSGFDHMISPSSTTFTPIDVYNTPYMYSDGTYDTPGLGAFGVNLGQVRPITYEQASSETSTTGKVLTVKSNEDGFKNKLTSWVNNVPLIENKIGVTSENIGTYPTDRERRKDTGVDYSAKSPLPFYTHTWKEYYTCGKTTCVRSLSEQLTPSYVKPKYTIHNVFDIYQADKPKESDITEFSTEKDSSNGVLFYSRQTDDSFEVVPEVAMQTYDFYGNSSINFYSGEYKRELQPVTMTSAKFKEIEVKPSVEGASVATDNEAKQLAGRLNANTKSVIYKGSALNMSFQTDGYYEVKNFVLDIGNTGLKNSWGNDYQAGKVVEDSMKDLGFISKGGGEFIAPLQFNGSLYFNDINWGGKSKVINTEQSKPQEVKEHKLEVRSGQLIAVNGDYNFRENLKKTDPELLNALKLTQLSTARNDNVLDSFEVKTGDELDNDFNANVLTGKSDETDIKNEDDLDDDPDKGDFVAPKLIKSADDFIEKANKMRHLDREGVVVKQQKVGDRWYNEDTTVLVLREFINTYKFPKYVYTDKMPLKVEGIETPVDKNDFFNKGYVGHTELTIKLNSEDDSFMTWNTDPAYEDSIKGTKPSIEYVVPNVSITDTFQQ